ncbi:MAG: chemotaxis protein CheW [Reichenbachiella sp.]|uniref:chemotaxis protein CheW n=1 Tax=Reichenbachiella sp. TaxID=2184521 RepID=UPI00326476A7
MEPDNQQEVLEEIEEQEQIEEGTREQLIVFKLGEGEYALPIAQIKEVVLTPRISTMPQTPDYVKGIANIRGNVISIMDFEEKFGLNGRSKKASNGHGINYTLVIESEEYHVGILVKEVPNTLTVLSSKIDSSANIMQHSTLDESVIKGIVKIKGRMIILIDVLLMMQSGEIKTKL